MNSVLVIGSSNTDMVISVDNLPLPGQTVMGSDFQTFGGGKGANQAVAARRAGGDVSFIAAVGNDGFGDAAVDTFNAEGINTSRVQTVEGASSGVALIFVSEEGENCIGVAPGANGGLTPEMLHHNQDAFIDADMVLLQLETPIETVAAAIELASRHNTPCILNPAPAAEISDSLLEKLFCITPNESEAQVLTGIAVTDEASATAAADVLLQRGVENVVITMGEHGVLLRNGDGSHIQAAESVDVVDTTAAGDTFNGVFAAMLARGQSLIGSIETAVAAATQSVQVAGAIASIPYLDQ